MLGKLYENQNCSASRALEVVGERWSLLILRDAMFTGCTRFSQFQKSLGVATNILAKRLEDFVEAGLMEHRPGVAGEQAEYVLTRMGLEMMPTIIALSEWGDKWSPRPGPVFYSDKADGQPLKLQLQRVDDGRPVDVADVGVTLR